MNIVIPAAGNGQRFRDAGYTQPKPLIDVCGRPMIAQVLRNIMPSGDIHIIVIARREHNLSLPDSIRNGVLIELDNETGGAVATILEAESYMERDEPLLIANCDQLAAFDPSYFVKTDLDARLIVFQSSNPHHSYVRTDENGFVIEIAEKKVISDQAVTGIYYFKSGKEFMQAAHSIVDSGSKTNGEFYVSSVIAHLIKEGKRIGVHIAPSAMLGTPTELQNFLVAAEVSSIL